MLTATRLDRVPLVEWYRRNRERSKALFDLLADEAYYAQPISLRHPLVFYDGHLPGFSFNTLVKKALGRPSIDARLETLFARGIDPHEDASATTSDRPTTTDQRPTTSHQPQTTSLRTPWPSREEVRAFADEADRQVIDALTHAEIEQPWTSIARPCGSGVQHPRARSDAPGNAAVPVASSAFRAEAASGGVLARDEWPRSVARTDQGSGWTCDAWRLSRRHSIRLG